MHLLRLVFMALVFSSCLNKGGGSSDVIIEGNTTGIPDGKLYLVDARKWKTVIDSANCKNGRFIFRINTDSSFVPVAAAIHYWKKDDTIRPIRLQFRNHTLADSLQSLRDIFFLEKGEIFITGHQGASPHLRIEAGKETALLFKYQHTDIGWMGYKDTAERNRKMLLLKAAISKNPTSFFLLQSIFDAKELYSKSELQQLLSMFNQTTKHSAAGRRFDNYMRLRPDDGAAYPRLSFFSSQGGFRSIIDTAATLNVLVFWASWCRPCLQEIPQLDAVYREFNNKPVRFKSISIDTDKGAWERAVQYYRMGWPQLFVGSAEIEKVENIFNFTTIPFLVITDSRGREVARFADYDENAKEKIRAVINSKLSTP